MSTKKTPTVAGQGQGKKEALRQAQTAQKPAESQVQADLKASWQANTTGNEKPRSRARQQVDAMLADSAALEAAAREDATRQEREDQTPAKIFTGVTASIIKQRPPMEWRIKRLLPAQGIAMLYGHSNTGKSLTLIDMAAKIALGEPWHGLKTKPAHVGYFYLEGSNGLARRIAAWEDVTGKTYPESVVFYDQQPLDVLKDAPAMASALPQGSVCIIDTLIKSCPGMDTSSNADMAAWLYALTANLVLPLKCLVMFAHHTLKGNRAEHLGAGCLYNDTDAVLQLEAKGTVVTLTDTKQRDEARGKGYSFEIKATDLWEDEDGDMVTGAAVVPCETPPPGRNEKRKLTPNEEQALAALIDITGGGTSGTKPGPESVPLDYWREAFYAASTSDPGTKRKAFSRAREGLVLKGYVSVFNDVYKVISDDYT